MRSLNIMKAVTRVLLFLARLSPFATLHALFIFFFSFFYRSFDRSTGRRMRYSEPNVHHSNHATYRYLRGKRIRKMDGISFWRRISPFIFFFFFCNVRSLLTSSPFIKTMSYMSMKGKKFWKFTALRIWKF